jgi:hypothetical protein
MPGPAAGFRRLRSGELIALAGAACVVAALIVPWYRSPAGQLGVWRTFGAAPVLLALAAAAALGLAVATVTERGSALPIAVGVWTVPLGLAALIAAFVRLFERPDHASALSAGAWLALAGAAAILAGAWQSLRDERTSTFEPPAHAPAPRPRP